MSKNYTVRLYLEVKHDVSIVSDEQLSPEEVARKAIDKTNLFALAKEGTRCSSPLTKRYRRDNYGVPEMS
jgi:hypothetical protein